MSYGLGVLKVLYSTPSVLAMYECYMISESGHCDASHSYVEILVRPGVVDIPAGVLSEIEGRLTAACLDPRLLTDLTSEGSSHLEINNFMTLFAVLSYYNNGEFGMNWQYIYF